MSELETIHRAAVRLGDTVYSVMPPGRHHGVIHQMVLGLKLGPQTDAWEQGFVTSTGRFVDRIEGCIIAGAAGQIKKKHGPEYMLFSEDMW